MDFQDLDLPEDGETSADVAQRVAAAHSLQQARFEAHPDLRTNADAQGKLLEDIATPDTEGRDFLLKAAGKFGLTARGYHRILRIARTIADLDQSPDVRAPHVAEAVSYRMVRNAV